MTLLYTNPNPEGATARNEASPPAIVQPTALTNLGETAFGSNEPAQDATEYSAAAKDVGQKKYLPTYASTKRETASLFALAEEHKLFVRDVQDDIATVEVSLDIGPRSFQIPVANLRDMGLAHIARNDTLLMKIFRGPLGIRTVFSQPDESILRREPDAPGLTDEYISMKRKQLGLE